MILYTALRSPRRPLALLFMIGLVVSLLWGCQKPAEPTAIQGQLDLSKWSFESSPVLDLTGQWDLQWQQESTYRQVPLSWEKHQNQLMPVRGQGEYTLKINISPEDIHKSFKVYIPNSGPYFRIWANHKLVAQSGLKLDDGHKSTSRTQSTLSFVPQKTLLTLKIWSENVGEYRNGLRSAPRFGLTEAVDREILKRQSMLSLIMGASLIFMLHHLVLFFQRRKEIKLLYFSLICGISLIYIEFFHAHLLEYLFAEIPLWVSLRLTRVAAFGFLLLGALYIEEAFEIPYFKGGLAFLRFSTGLLFASLLLPLYWGNTVFLAYLLLACFVNLSSYWIIYKAWRYRRPGIGIFIFTGAIFAITCLHDIFYDLRFFQSYYLIPLGYFVFCLGQSTLLSRHFQDDYEQVKTLGQALQSTNADLEQRVLERTETLAKQSQELKGLLAFKDKIARMLAHDLKNPLGVILYFSKSSPISAEAQEAIHRSSLDMQNLIHHLQQIETLERPELQVEPVVLNLKTQIESALGSMHSLTRSKNIQISNDVPGDLWISADGYLLERVMQNLLSNALKSTPREGIIQVSAKPTPESTVEVCIQDTGPGIATYRLPTLFELKTEHLTEVAISGLGLPFCKLAIEAQGGQIKISNAERGAKACFSLPAASAPE